MLIAWNARLAFNPDTGTRYIVEPADGDPPAGSLMAHFPDGQCLELWSGLLDKCEDMLDELVQLTGQAPETTTLYFPIHTFPPTKGAPAHTRKKGPKRRQSA